MATFNATYIKTTVLATFEDGRNLELGHYKENGKNGKEYADKIYITSKYKDRQGKENESVKATGLTLKDLAEVQKIDLSSFDTESEVTFD